jgi:hypothetical protein
MTVVLFKYAAKRICMKYPIARRRVERNLDHYIGRCREHWPFINIDRHTITHTLSFRASAVSSEFQVNANAILDHFNADLTIIPKSNQS